MASGIYNRGLLELISGSTVWASSTVKVMLLKPTYTFNRDHLTVSEVVAHELTSTNYVRKTLASMASSQNDTLDAAYLDAGDVTWASPNIAAGQTAAYAVIFRDTGNDATASLLACYDLQDTDPNGGSFRVEWNAAGLVKATSAS